jgi:hypothetical protein
MDKRAQQRSRRSKIWEAVNLTGKGLEYIHSEFGAVMDEMRIVDENIRNIAEDVRPLIRSAKSSLRQRDYLSAALSVSEFHRRVRHIAYILGKFAKSVDIKHYKYLLDNFDSSNKDLLFGYDPNAELKEACEHFDLLIKEAGALDWIKDKADVISDTVKNVLTDTGRARRKLEKQFSAKFMNAVIKQTKGLVESASRMLSELLSIFGKLESGVSRRNVAMYTEEAGKFVDKFKSFHTVYEDYDKKILTPLRAHQTEINEQEKQEQDRQVAEKQEKEKARQQEVEKAKQEREMQEYNEQQEALRSPLVNYEEPIPSKEEVEYNEPSVEEWKKQKQLEKDKLDILNKLDQELDSEDKTNNSPEVSSPKAPMPWKRNVAHEEFVDRIIVNAQNEDVFNFVNNLINYSEILENSNPESSADLLMIASDVINEYKSAAPKIWDTLFNRKKLEKEPENTADPIKPQEVKKKDKPQELLEYEEEFLRPKPIDIPNGNIDVAYSDIPFLSSITPDRIRVTPDATRPLIQAFARRLTNVLKITDLQPHIKLIEQNLVSSLKQGVYDGWVVYGYPSIDDFHPLDKYLDIYTRLKLSNIDPALNGIAKITVKCRISAQNKTITIRGIKPNFEIEMPKEHKTEQEEIDDEDITGPDYDDRSLGDYDDTMEP